MTDSNPADPVHVLALAAGVNLGTALARLGGQRAVYSRCLEYFRSELREHRTLDARRLHSLQGNAATLGAQALADELQALGSGTAGRPGPEQEACVRTLLDEARPGLEALAEALHGEPGAQAAPEPAPAAGAPAPCAPSCSAADPAAEPRPSPRWSACRACVRSAWGVS
ncbi:MAG: hypothetical protein U1E77_09460 [Inhella sp.]